MFRWIIGSSLQFRFLVVGVAAALVAFGAVGLRNMPVDVFPEFAAPVVEVQTEAIGLSAKELVSEDGLAAMRGLRVTRIFLDPEIDAATGEVFGRILRIESDVN